MKLSSILAIGYVVSQNYNHNLSPMTMDDFIAIIKVIFIIMTVMSTVVLIIRTRDASAIFFPVPMALIYFLAKYLIIGMYSSMNRLDDVMQVLSTIP